MDPTTLDSNVLDEVIPIVFGLAIGATVICAQWLIYRLKKARLEAMKQALVARLDLDSDEITTLLGAPQSRRSDLRKAILAMAVGCGCLLAGAAATGDLADAVATLSTISFALAAAYLLFVVLRLQIKA